MTVKPTVASVVGPTTAAHWGQVLNLPNAYGVVELAYEDAGARVAGIHLLSVLSQRLAEAPVSLHALREIISDVVKEGVVTILLCVPVGPVVYIVLHGDGDVYLKRGRQFAQLLHGQGSISGEIQPGDTIILASAEFSHALTQTEASTVFDHLSPTEVAERLTLLLHEKPYGEGSAALVLQFHEADIFANSSQAKPPEESGSALAQAGAFFAHFRPVTFARVRRHFSIPVFKHDLVRLRSHPKKATAIFTVLLIFFFGVAVAVGIWKQQTTGTSPKVVAAVSDARHALDEGVALMPLNPVKGRERLNAAKTILDPLTQSVPVHSTEGREIADLMRQITDNLTQSMQVSQVKPDLFFDASLVKKGATITSVGLEGTTMGLVDTATQTVYSLDVTSKNAQVLGGGSAYSGLSYAAIHGTNVFVLVDGGVNAVSVTDKKTVPFVVKKDPQWGTIRALESFGGNLYLLDTTKSRIWKYVSTDTGFSDLKEYLNPDTLPDLSHATSLAIDGSVWLGTSDGQILKFTQGKVDTFNPQGVSPALGNNLLVYTSDTVANIYVLDSQNKRVVVLAKDGTYTSQYVWTDSLTPTQFVVSEDQKKIYLLAGGKLYSIGLK